MTVWAPDDFDYTPLSRTGGLRARLQAVAGDNRLRIAATIMVLLIVLPPVILAALLATVENVDSGGVWVLGFVFACGLGVGADLVRQAGGVHALARFASANDLQALPGSVALHYTGSLFADGSYRVQQGVRTREDHFVEVGDRFPTKVGGARGPHVPELYLRARLSGPATRSPDGEDLVTPLLHDQLTRFAGAYTVEVSGGELTIFGTRGLETSTPGRLREAFALLVELAERAETVLMAAPLPDRAAAPGPTPSGVPIPAFERLEPEPTQPRSAVAIGGYTLVLLLLGSIAIAIVMSVLDDNLRGNALAARVVVPLVLVAIVAVVELIIRWLLNPRRVDAYGSQPRRRRRPQRHR